MGGRAPGAGARLTGPRPATTLSTLALNGLSTPAGLEPVLSGAAWLEAPETGASIDYDCPTGSLAAYRFLTADFLLSGTELAVFELVLGQGEGGPALRFSFGLLNQCQARPRMPLAAADQNR